MNTAIVGAVVVTFHPDADFPQRIAAIAREFAPVLIVDNTPGRSSLVATTAAIHHCELLTTGENSGLAAALNTAFATLAARGLSHAVAFDQDSTPAPGFAAALLAAAARHPAAAIVGANWHEAARPHFPSRHLRHHPTLPFLFSRPSASAAPAAPATADLTDLTCVITSGTLFRLSTWRDLGGFSSDLFLDLVDTEFCLRARAAGHGIVVAPAARLAHRRGAKQPIRRFGRTWWPAFMPPTRLHYLFRNRILVATRHGARAPHWVAFEIVYATKVLLEILFLEPDKPAKFAACARGTWDGLLGATGPLA